MSFSGPIAKLGISYALEINPEATENQLSVLETAFTGFLENNIDYSTCSSICLQTIGTMKPLNKIVAIIQIPNSPIPMNFIDQTKRKNMHWTKYENQRLIAGIFRYGLNDWANVAKFVGNGRTKLMCSQRWSRAINPQISKDKWTKEEEDKLIKLIELKGDRSWTYIASQMGNRSDVQCRYHYRLLMLQKNDIISNSISSSMSLPSKINEMKFQIPSIKTFFEEPCFRPSKLIPAYLFMSKQ